MTRPAILTQLTADGGSLKGNSGACTIADLDRPDSVWPTGVYVHVPFCFHKCHYCDFYSIVDNRDRQGAFTDRLVMELQASKGFMAEPLETIFFGGGTPTLLAPAHWERVLAALGDGVRRAEGVEFTVEANPETVTEELVEILAAGGVNRASIGGQSFNPRHLETLERWHEPENVARSVDRLRAGGIENLNIDLIFGIPGQTPEEWLDDLERALALAPDHLSCYGLTYEPNTALTARLRAGRVTPVEESIEATMYELAMDRLADAGFEQYEISAWARPARRCAHNIKYWTNADWWPLGPGAAGHLRGLRWKNIPRLGDYLDTAPFAPITEVETPDPERRVADTIMMGLRLNDGLPLDALPPDDARAAAITRHLDAGLLHQTSTHLALTRRGRLLADLVIGDLL